MSEEHTGQYLQGNRPQTDGIVRSLSTSRLGRQPSSTNIQSANLLPRLPHFPIQNKNDVQNATIEISNKEATVFSETMSPASTSTNNIERQEHEYEIVRASGLRRKTILIDLHDPEAPISRLLTYGEEYPASSQISVVSENIEEDQNSNPTTPAGSRKVSLANEIAGSTSAVIGRRKTSILFNTRNTNMSTIESTPNLGEGIKRQQSVSFAADYEPKRSSSITPAKQGSFSPAKSSREGSMNQSRRSTASLFATPPQYNNLQNKSVPENGVVGFNFPVHTSDVGGRLFPIKQPENRITSMTVGIKDTPVNIVNAKVPAGPNHAVLAEARRRCRDRNADVLAMVGTYDPWPIFWPNAKQEKEKRMKKGRPTGDEWKRNQENVPKDVEKINGARESVESILTQFLPSNKGGKTIADVSSIPSATAAIKAAIRLGLLPPEIISSYLERYLKLVQSSPTSPARLEAESLCCTLSNTFLASTILDITATFNLVVSERAEPLIQSLSYKTDLLVNILENEASIANNSLTELLSLSLHISLSPDYPRSVQSRLVSTVVPLFFNYLQADLVCNEIWNTITVSSLKNTRSQTFIMAILVHNFNHFFGLTSKSIEKEKFEPPKSSQKKKLRRQNAKEGIMSDGGRLGDGTIVNEKDDDRIDWDELEIGSFPVLDLRHRTEFWELIHNGLVCGEHLIEKYCLFLLKRVVDYCSKSKDDIEIPGSLETASLYNVSGLGSFVSPFGEKVRMFIKQITYLSSDKPKCLDLLITFCVNFSARASCIYVLMGLNDVATEIGTESNFAVLGPKTVSKFSEMMMSNRAASIWTKNFSKFDAQQLFCKLATNIVITFSDSKLFTFKDISAILRGLYQTPASPLFDKTRAWCLKGFGAKKAGNQWLSSEISVAVKLQLTADTTVSMDLNGAENIASMVALLFRNLPDLRLALKPLLSRLQTLNSSAAYAPSGTSQRAVILICAILDILTDVPNLGTNNGFSAIFGQDLSELVVVCVAAIKIGKYNDSTPVFVLRNYARVLKECFTQYSKCFGVDVSFVRETIREFVLAIESSKLRFGDGTQTHHDIFCRLVGLKVAFEVSRFLKHTDISINKAEKILEIILKDLKWLKPVSNEKINWSEVQNEIQIFKYEAMEAVLDFIITAKYTMTHKSVEFIVVNCSESVRKTSNIAVPHIFRALTRVIEIVSATDSALEYHNDVICSVIKDGMDLVIENLVNAKNFAILCEAYTKMVFCPSLLYASVKNEKLKSVITESLLVFADIFISFLLFGPTRDRATDQDRMDAVISYNLKMPYILKSWNSAEVEDSFGTTELNFNCMDYVLRVKANDILSRLKPENEIHREFGQLVLSKLLDLHLSNKYFAKFEATYEHRMQTRIWCSIHVLIGYVLNIEEFAEKFVEAVKGDLIVSTRSLLDWAAIRVFLKHPDVTSKAWDCLKNFDLKAPIICSFFSILKHVGPLLPSSHQKSFYDMLFDKILPWLTSNHFTIRLYAQYVAYEAWQYCSTHKQQNGLETVIDTHANSFGAIIKFVEKNNDCIKHRKQAVKLYFVGGGFHPVDDVSMDFIFRGSLLISGITDEEKISGRAFDRICGVSARHLKTLHPVARKFLWSSKLMQELDDNNAVRAEVRDIEEEYFEVAGGEMELSLQRKIEPWETMMENDTDFSIATRIKTRERFPLIVVASLITKAPNLGGLCRTCEIFNTELLVVGDMRVREDPSFLVTAVTAEKWMPMQEVPYRGNSIKEFLIERKQAGYAIVGIEQASNSVSLNTFEFPPKVVLLLGKEKLGIPAEYMVLLDHVIEIEQFGVVRSLNVHVSGALVVHAFAKQRSVK
ncbi:Tar (HIV-1) RNA binding protein 1 [Physocladia obscura]|uniref:Tar (HIV-1) RNA binding protein 1 n=1 Tax=Physocladia obscura TaxID=109957 RepID=A0AAD5SXQ3_9FUNG|nr:Tar (HIV-1) RNA binding protein 1 [Physocladia obscura]